MLKRCVAVTHTGAVLTYDALPISDRPTDWGGNSWQYSRVAFSCSLVNICQTLTHSLLSAVVHKPPTAGSQSVGYHPMPLRLAAMQLWVGCVSTLRTLRVSRVGV